MNHRGHTQPIRFETYCLFCGKTWSVQLGSPQLSCSCGANINCLKDLSTKAAQDLEEKVFSVLMDAWQEKMGESRKRQLQPPPMQSKVLLPPTIQNKELSPEDRIQWMIVKCSHCKVNVLVPDVKMFRCGSCDQCFQVEKKSQNTKNLDDNDLTSLQNMANRLPSSSSASSSASSSSMSPITEAPP
jgi:hypothetical protein